MLFLYIMKLIFSIYKKIIKQKKEVQMNKISLNYIIDKLKKNEKQLIIFFIILFLSVILYSILIKEQLINDYDGLWHCSYRQAGNWELSLGRWFLYYLDRVHFCINVEPLSSIMSLGCIAAGMLLILKIFNIESIKKSILISMLFLSNVVVCVFLSYRYASLTYGISFLLSILSVYVIIKIENTYTAISIGSLLVALYMGCYQGQLGCTCIVILAYLMYILLDKEKTYIDVLKHLLRGITTIILGGVIYILLLKIHLLIFNTELASYQRS